MTRGLVILPSVENLQIWDADVVSAAIFLNVDSILDGQADLLPPVLQTQHRGQILLALLGQLARQAGLQRGELVTDVGLQFN